MCPSDTAASVMLIDLPAAPVELVSLFLFLKTMSNLKKQ